MHVTIHVSLYTISWGRRDHMVVGVRENPK
jgi:hypothetical protein